MKYLSILFFILAGAGVTVIVSPQSQEAMVGAVVETLIFLALGVLCYRKWRKKNPKKSVKCDYDEDGMRAIPYTYPPDIKKPADQYETKERYANQNALVAINLGFVPRKRVGTAIWFSDDRFAIPKIIKKKAVVTETYDVNEVIHFEVLEDGKTVTSGGLGRAAVGGVLLGGVGAVVGAVTGGKTANKKVSSIRLKLTLEDIENPVVYVEFLPTNGLEVKADTPVAKRAYQQIEEAVSIFQILQSKKDQGN